MDKHSGCAKWISLNCARSQLNQIWEKEQLRTLVKSIGCCIPTAELTVVADGLKPLLGHDLCDRIGFVVYIFRSLMILEHTFQYSRKECGNSVNIIITFAPVLKCVLLFCHSLSQSSTTYQSKSKISKCALSAPQIPNNSILDQRSAHQFNNTYHNKNDSTPNKKKRQLIKSSFPQNNKHSNLCKSPVA